MPHPLQILTPRQRKVALLIAQGFDNEAVAVKARLKPTTVRVYARNIYSRLGISKWGNPRVRLANLVWRGEEKTDAPI